MKITKEADFAWVCPVCHAEFIPAIDGHYVARNNTSTGLVTVIKGDESALWDAFDCPACGSQAVTRRRLRSVSLDDTENEDTESEVESEDTEGADAETEDAEEVENNDSN